MAIGNIVKRKIGEQVRDWVYLGIRTGARFSIEQAELMMEQGKTEEAILQIKRAVDMPNRARARIDYFISQYGQPLLIECLTLAGDCTIAELNAELTTLENYAGNLVTRKNAGESWTDIAQDIKTNVEKESLKWVFPFPPGYTDVWGE